MQKGNPFLKLISSKLDPDLADALHYHINSVIYDYSDHHQSNSPTLKTRIKKWLSNSLRALMKFSSLVYGRRLPSGKIVLSNAYVSLHSPNTTFLLPPWQVSLKRKNFVSYRLLSSVERLNWYLAKKEIGILFSKEFANNLVRYQVELQKYIKEYKIAGLIVPNDLSFFENISVKIAQKLNTPTFVYLHGLPARYNSIDDNRADYLIVWGKGIKDNYVKAGVAPTKILTLPHPVYKDFKETKLMSSLENVLVLTKAMSGTPSSSDELVLSDRGRSLFYAEEVKRYLMALGVKRARLRLHPSEVASFYTKNFTDDFYTIDTLGRDESLAQATLIIGPTSTMVLDAIKKGKNYLLFEPIQEGKTLENMKVVSPFDGTGFIKLSNNLEDIKRHIAFPNENIDFQLLNDFFETDPKDSGRFIQLLNK